MDGSKAVPLKEMPLGIDAMTEDEYALQSRLLQEFTSISSFDKAWIKSDSRNGSQAMFSISQPNLLANKRRKFILSSHISKESSNSVKFEWAPFPVEMTGVSVIVPSPSGSKLLVVRNPEAEAPCQFEIWGPAQVEKEFHIPQSVHGSVYADEWFQGISWNSDETLIAYVAEEPSPPKPTFRCQGYKKGSTIDKDSANWKGQGEWEEEWGETYVGKRQPALFVININSGDTQAVKGIEKHLSVGQVVWAPPVRGSHQYLVFVGWSADTRKLGIKYCYNRPCALYAVKAPLYGSEADGQEINSRDNSIKDSPVVNLTESISSAYHPRFSPDGKLLLFLSSRSAVDSGAHSATDSLHRIDWPIDGVPCSSFIIFDVIPVVMCADDGCFSGLYCSSFLSNPWFSDGCTMVVSSFWGSCQVVLSVNVLSGEDVNDVLVAVDHVIDMGLASPSKIAILGGSHGGFLTTHLIGQAPEKFFVAATRNPACNLALMVGTTDIPDWCYVEAYGTEGKNRYTEAPSAEHLALFHSKSPISQISKAKTPTLFLLGAQDIRLPICSGLQYARALKEKGVAVKVIVFPNDNHPIDKPQSDFESFLNIGVWFKRYLF